MVFYSSIAGTDSGQIELELKIRSNDPEGGPMVVAPGETRGMISNNEHRPRSGSNCSAKANYKIPLEKRERCYSAKDGGMPPREAQHPVNENNNGLRRLHDFV